MTTIPKLDYLSRHTEIHRLREQGWTIRAIAQAVGLSAGGVHKALRRPPGTPDGRGRHPRSRDALHTASTTHQRFP
ncbi:helix-turn-helix domain-containing protein [Mycolicibacterium fortuitum]|uniref:Helix-turn-helix domain-containing protein n=2 Tax=Mycolicibacterium fortuitum TaxID=1766 RepID=A0AAE4V877_MYCFO|nr:helix-turn-helix domain-containing protein [Mycolicibacterium fortuitum]MCV7141409.1 helix-turn-helix domain-containing protein [Mycolicibacterium fortuitum]MDV7189605.1 helix-turn-helix domain-containing protein [Mycolicibacterium fortuitum]MDV7203098.1 helix-turn-helix domain-containing protein [Mycolicibacterium fortuitum]MDV7224686.1 helix-turn-helix domain-containing protein [Mycolicibacterium fortuitum]MDV7256808.1 helix-turn-helix domain-containing protein [Mycolicibacterium fortuitu